MVRCRGRLLRDERVHELVADPAISSMTMSRTAWGDNVGYVDGFDGSSHSLLQSIYGSQASQILLSGRPSEAQLVIEEVDEDGWSDEENVTVSLRPGSSQGSPSAPAVRGSQTRARPSTALPYSSHHHYRPTPPSSSTSLGSTASSRGRTIRPFSAVRSRPSSGRPQAHTGHEQKLMTRRPMSAAVPRSYSMQGASRRSSIGDGAAGQSQLLNRSRPKSAFVGSTRSAPLLDYDSSEEDQFAARAPLRNTNPVFRTHVPEYINFWGGKPLQNRDFGAVVHERKPWKRPSSDYGTRRASSRKSSTASSGAEKKASDDLLAGIGGDAGNGAGGQVGGCQWNDTRGESARGVGLQDGGGLMRGGLLQGKDGSLYDKNKDGAGFSGIGGSLLDGLVNGEDDSGKAPKRDTSENDRNRKAYRSGTHSENRYGKGQREDEGSAGSEEEDFFKKSVDDKLPTIPSSSSLTGGGSEGGLGCIDELASESTDSMSDGDGTLSGAGDTGRTGVLPQLVANPPVLLLPSKTGSPKTQKRVCHLDRYRLEFDTIRFCEPQALDKPPKDAKWLSARLALTRHSTRFELPLDLRDLQGLSPADYLQKYTVVSERRAAHYTKVYRRFLKPPSKAIARKDLVPALREVHFGTVDEEQIIEVLQVVQLSEDVNDIDLKLFAGLCALAERMLRAFTLPTRSTSALTEYGQHREIVEDADFEALEWKLRGITINDSLQTLFTKL